MDPSGHKVVIGGWDVEAMFAATNSGNYMMLIQMGSTLNSPLAEAWNIYCEVMPYQSRILIGWNETIIIKPGVTDEGNAGQASNNEITISSEYLSDTVMIAALIAHEVIHPLTKGNSIYEETLAMQNQAYILEYFGRREAFQYKLFRNVDMSLPKPQLERQLIGIQEYFQKRLNEIRYRNLVQNVTFEAWETPNPYDYYIGLDIFPADYDNYRRIDLN